MMICSTVFTATLEKKPTSAPRPTLQAFRQLEPVRTYDQAGEGDHEGTCDESDRAADDRSAGAAVFLHAERIDEIVAYKYRGEQCGLDEPKPKAERLEADKQAVDKESGVYGNDTWQNRIHNAHHTDSKQDDNQDPTDPFHAVNPPLNVIRRLLLPRTRSGG
jgi:hypothetical protein